MNKLSIILPVHNEYQYTRWCLFSLVNRTKTPHEIIIVNDHSDERTTQFLKGFARDNEACVYHEMNERGWHSGSCNFGMKKATGNYICLLNSDTIVATGWDVRMIDFLEKPTSQDISVVGPSTSYCASHQQLPQYHKQRYTFKYHETEDLGKEVYDRYKGQSMITRVTGFCLMFKSEMLDKIGYLDQELFPSAGNECDWILRGLKKQLKPCWVKDAYVHHYGEASYAKAIGRQEKEKKWQEADGALIKKHGKPVFDVIQKAYWRNQRPEY